MANYKRNYTKYVMPVFDSEAGIEGWSWEVAQKDGPIFKTRKEAEVDFMWFLFNNRMILPGEVIEL